MIGVDGHRRHFQDPSPPMKHLTISTCLCALALLHTGLHAQKLKVYILAGQSNMEGHAKVSTFDYIGEDPATAPLDPFCRTYDHPNLFVVDASFLPTSAAVNPALTIAAQALRVGDHIMTTELKR